MSKNPNHVKDASSQGPARVVQPARLRREFVSMLFALAVGQVAIFAFAVFEARGCADAGISVVCCRFAAGTHLALALLVIATSWIGWSRSLAAEREVEGFFDPDFVPWIIDVLLVILYFFLACSAEVENGFDPSNAVLAAPSALPELKWTWWLLVLYAIWDAATKWFPSEADRTVKGKMTLRSWARNAFATCLASGSSIAVLSVIWLLARMWLPSATMEPYRTIGVVSIDVALMAIIVLFRVLKSAELDWFRDLRLVDGGLPETQWEKKALWLFVVGVMCCGVSYFVSR